jgi:hypothetical protein
METIRKSLPIVKLDVPQRVAYGWASVTAQANGQPVVDCQGDVIAVDDLEKAVHGFLAKGGVVKAMHAGGSVARVVESFLSTPTKLQKLGLAPDALPQGWFVGVKVEDEATWQRVATGELKAFSIGGKGRREEM